jgi:uncharacterized protein
LLLPGAMSSGAEPDAGDALNADDVVPVEINPRYTASIEVLERALGQSAIGLHVAACRGGLPIDSPMPDVDQPQRERWYGKQVIYSDREGPVSPSMTADLLDLNRGHDWPLIADIPRPDTRLVSGQPALTVLAEAASRAALVDVLSLRRREARRLLGAG